MRSTVLALALTGVILGAALPAHAQNVAVPQDNKSSGMQSLFNFFMPRNEQTQAPAAQPQAQQQAAPKPVLPDTASIMPQTPAPAARPTTFNAVLAQALYLPADQQEKFVALEQNSITSLQTALSQMARVQSSMPSPTSGKTQQERDSAATLQQINQQAVADINAQILMSQQRLKILQSGPLKITDFGKLYQ